MALSLSFVDGSKAPGYAVKDDSYSYLEHVDSAHTLAYIAKETYPKKCRTE